MTTRAQRRAVDDAREQHVDVLIRDRVKMAFSDVPALQSAWLAVSQYWNDEADDAVHGLLVFSQLPEPSLEAWRADDALEDHFDQDEYDDLLQTGQISQSENLGGVVFPPGCGLHDQGCPGTLWVPWKSNGEAIRLFAAWCSEGSHQEMKHSECFRPIVLYQRRGDDVLAKWIAKPLRPWLRWVSPTWG